MKIVKSIKKIQTETVFDITVDKHSHYILDSGIVSHNSGLRYVSSTIVFLTKGKDRADNKDVIGNFLRIRMEKSRLSKENSFVEAKLSYEKGLDKYYGLLDLGEKHGLFKKVSHRYEMPDGIKAFEKQIYSNPEKFFTKEILDKLDECAKKEFAYGQNKEQTGEEESEETYEDDELYAEAVGN